MLTNPTATEDNIKAVLTNNRCDGSLIDTLQDNSNIDFLIDCIYDNTNKDIT